MQRVTTPPTPLRPHTRGRFIFKCDRVPITSTVLRPAYAINHIRRFAAQEITNWLRSFPFDCPSTRVVIGENSTLPPTTLNSILAPPTTLIPLRYRRKSIRPQRKASNRPNIFDRGRSIRGRNYTCKNETSPTGHKGSGRQPSFIFRKKKNWPTVRHSHRVIEIRA